MRAKRHYILNWLLISMMVMLPLRSVLAFDLADCQMQHEASSQTMIDHTMADQSMVDHSAHMMPDPTQADTGLADSGNSHNCCSDKDMMCNSDCASVINMSFVIQTPVLIENSYHSVIIARTSTDVLLRTLPPLERPPAHLQS